VPGVPSFELLDRLLVVNDGALERWRLLTDGEVSPLPGVGVPVEAVWAGTDVVVALEDGRVARIGAQGPPRLDVVAPGCASGCAALPGLGAFGDETWSVGPGGLQRWDASGAPLGKHPRPTGQLAVDRLADGRYVSLGGDGRLRVGDGPGQGKVVGTLPGAIGIDVSADLVVAWSPDGLLVAGADGTERTAPFFGPGRAPEAVALSPDGARVAVIDDQGALHVYRTSDGAGELGLPLGLGGHALGWSADGERLFAAREGIRVFSATDGEELVTLVFGSEVRSIEISAAGEVLARTADGAVTVDPAALE
jgi:hypothetical protein